MRVSEITIKGYQGVGYLDLEIEKPIVLVAGKNGTGKTTVRDAIQFAITGTSSRVSLKKDYPALVRVGATPKDCEVAVTADGFTFRRGVASGKSKGEDPDFPAVLPIMLGNQRFALLPQKDRAAAIYMVSRVKRDRERVKALLEERKIHPECIEGAYLMLRRGFDEAEKFCKEGASKARGAWEAVTGERFGTSKADGWEAPPIETEPAEQLIEERDRLEKSLPKLQEEIDKAQERLLEFRQHQSRTIGLDVECPACAAKLRYRTGGDKGPHLVLHEETDEPETDPEEQQKAQATLNGARAELEAVQIQIAKYGPAIEQAQNADRLREETTAKAARYFEKYNEWQEAAAALAPSGIPLQLLEEALKPINQRFKQTTAATGWRDIVLSPDLELSYGGIPYGLASESEQWRVDAAVTEAFSALSGTKMFVLDRLDVIHPDDRGAILAWLNSLTGEHDTIFVMATLKSRPKLPLDDIQVVWLNEGGQMEKAA